VAEHLRQKVENHYFTTPEHITSSFGATLYAENENIAQTQTIESADKTLYMAKKTVETGLRHPDFGSICQMWCQNKSDK